MDSKYLDLANESYTATTDVYPWDAVVYGMRKEVSGHELKFANAQARLLEDIAGHLELELKAYVATMHTPEHAVCYPATWWDAFKERWYPAWAKRRWGVRMARVAVSFDVLYPELATNKDHGTIVVCKRIRTT